MKPNSFVLQLLSALWFAFMNLGVITGLKKSFGKNKPKTPKNMYQSKPKNYRASQEKDFFRDEMLHRITPTWNYLKQWANTEAGDLELMTLVTFLLHHLYKKSDLEAEERASLLGLLIVCYVWTICLAAPVLVSSNTFLWTAIGYLLKEIEYHEKK